MIKLYGIPNCDTVKKARNWLDGNNIAFEFCDFKKAAPTSEDIKLWLTQIPMEILLNKRGTTWRKLDETQKQAADTDRDTAVRLMAENPSLVKRPVLALQGRFYAGFTPEDYQKIFSEG